jgi:hypothetical protein
MRVRQRVQLRTVSLLLAVLVCSGLPGTLVRAAPSPSPAKAAGPTVQLRDLDNALVDPFQESGSARAIAFIFTSIGCPYSNRYAPEVRKLSERFTAKGVSFWLVYPNPAESATEIRAHLKAFGYPMRALRDPAHDLAKLTGVTVTPEAAVFDRRGSLAYHGRIDDRFVAIGVERPTPTRRDLQDVLTSVVAGRAVTASTQPAVGCFIADFVQ